MAQISLSELLSIPHHHEEHQVSLEADHLAMFGADHKVVAKEPFILSLTHEEGAKISLSGETSLTLLIPCSRCLDDVRVPFSLKIDEVIDFNGTGLDSPDELSYMDGKNLDVERLLFDEIFLNYPTKTLCKEDCKGICKVCGMNLNRGTCSCDQWVPDPRMAAFQSIFDQFKEEV